MKKAIVPLIVFVVGILLSFLMFFAERGWFSVFNLDPQAARFLFWITLGVTIALSSGLAIFKFRDKIRCWLPVLQLTKMDGVVTVRFESRRKPTDTFQRQSIKKSPDLFVFPYLRAVSYPFIKDGKDVLHIRFFCPSSLPYDLKLKRVSAHLTIGGVSIEHRLEENDEMEIFGQAPNGKTLYVPLTKEAKAMISKYAEQSQPVELYLEISGFDKKGKEHKLPTEVWTTIIQK